MHRLSVSQSINQSINLYLYQATKKKKKEHTQRYNITTQTNEKREKLSRYWSETSAAEVHTYIFQRFPQIKYNKTVIYCASYTDRWRITEVSQHVFHSRSRAMVTL